VVVGHHRVVAGFLNAKYRRGITPFRRSGKVFVFGENTASTPPGHPGGENLWARAFRLIVDEKMWDFRLLLEQFWQICLHYIVIALKQVNKYEKAIGL